MRNKLLFFCMLLAAMAVLLVAVAAVSSDRRDRIGDVIGYNVLAERVFEGSVESNPYMIEPIVYFPLRTANSVVQVQVGPKDFIERSNFKITANDMVTVTGMPIVMNGRHVVLAREIRSASGVLVVRDPIGLPLWENNTPLQMDPERQKAFFQLCALSSQRGFRNVGTRPGWSRYRRIKLSLQQVATCGGTALGA